MVSCLAFELYKPLEGKISLLMISAHLLNNHIMTPYLKQWPIYVPFLKTFLIVFEFLI